MAFLQFTGVEVGKSWDWVKLSLVEPDTFCDVVKIVEVLAIANVVGTEPAAELTSEVLFPCGKPIAERLVELLLSETGLHSLYRSTNTSSAYMGSLFCRMCEISLVTSAKLGRFSLMDTRTLIRSQAGSRRSLVARNSRMMLSGVRGDLWDKK